jgi:hypothetical protein
MEKVFSFELFLLYHSSKIQARAIIRMILLAQLWARESRFFRFEIQQTNAQEVLERLFYFTFLSFAVRMESI